MVIRFLPAVLAATALLGVTGVGEAAERAGTARKVQQASYQKTDVYPFNLNPGDEIYRNANVFTGEDGSVEILLDDGSDLTLGPNAEIVIDDYVYSPDTGSGAAVVSLTKGALRMISGAMNRQGIQVKTPVATIGIRGTDFVLDTTVPGQVGVWVITGTVIAAPTQTTDTFEIGAGGFAVCNAGGCAAGEPPALPISFPEPSEGRDFGPNDGESGGNT